MGKSTMQPALKVNGGGKYARAHSKIKTLAELKALANEYRQAGQKVVLAHGTFDLLHLGHARYFEEASRQGDVLFVTVN